VHNIMVSCMQYLTSRLCLCYVMFCIMWTVIITDDQSYCEIEVAHVVVSVQCIVI